MPETMASGAARRCAARKSASRSALPSSRMSRGSASDPHRCRWNSRVELDRQQAGGGRHRPQERGGGAAGARPELDHGAGFARSGPHAPTAVRDSGNWARPNRPAPDCGQSRAGTGNCRAAGRRRSCPAATRSGRTAVWPATGHCEGHRLSWCNPPVADLTETATPAELFLACCRALLFVLHGALLLLIPIVIRRKAPEYRSESAAGAQGHRQALPSYSPPRGPALGSPHDPGRSTRRHLLRPSACPPARRRQTASGPRGAGVACAGAAVCAGRSSR